MSQIIRAAVLAALAYFAWSAYSAPLLHDIPLPQSRDQQVELVKALAESGDSAAAQQLANYFELQRLAPLTLIYWISSRSPEVQPRNIREALAKQQKLLEANKDAAAQLPEWLRDERHPAPEMQLLRYRTLAELAVVELQRVVPVTPAESGVKYPATVRLSFAVRNRAKLGFRHVSGLVYLRAPTAPTNKLPDSAAPFLPVDFQTSVDSGQAASDLALGDGTTEFNYKPFFSALPEFSAGRLQSGFVPRAVVFADGSTLDVNRGLLDPPRAAAPTPACFGLGDCARKFVAARPLIAVVLTGVVAGFAVAFLLGSWSRRAALYWLPIVVFGPILYLLSQGGLSTSSGWCSDVPNFCTTVFTGLTLLAWGPAVVAGGVAEMGIEALLRRLFAR